MKFNIKYFIALAFVVMSVSACSNKAEEQAAKDALAECVNTPEVCDAVFATHRIEKEDALDACIKNPAVCDAVTKEFMSITQLFFDLIFSLKSNEPTSTEVASY